MKRYSQWKIVVVIGLLVMPLEGSLLAQSWGWDFTKAKAPTEKVAPARKPVASKGAPVVKTAAVSKKKTPSSGAVAVLAIDGLFPQTPIDAMDFSKTAGSTADAVARIPVSFEDERVTAAAVLSAVQFVPVSTAAPVADVVTSAPPAAADAAQATPEVAPMVEVRGFASFGYSYNFGRPASGTNQLRVFDFDDRHAKLDVGELVLQRPAAIPGAFGFRTDFVMGQSVPRVTAASGLFRDKTTGVASNGDFDLQQAFVSYVAPLGSGVRVDAGKFTSHVGAEVIEGYDGYNDNYTRSFLFGYAEPATHTGVRVGYTFNPKLSALVLVVNGWDNVLDSNSGKSIGAQIAMTPSDRVTVYANYIGGPERADSSDARHFFQLIAVAKRGDALTMTFGYDYGRERNAAGNLQNGVWEGASASAKMVLSPRYSVSARAEVFADPMGVRTGTTQTLTELTLTPWVRLSQHLLLRSDFRLDRSTQAVFESRDALVPHQRTVALNALVVF